MNDLVLLKRDLSFEIQRCVELFNSQALINRQIFSESAFIEILIRLNYVLQKLNDRKSRVCWTDNIQISTKINDITDLVNNLRNAACHIDSPENFVGDSSIKHVFNVYVGKCPNATQIGENPPLGCEYEDDFAFYYGHNRIYLYRHIKKILGELPNEIYKLK